MITTKFSKLYATNVFLAIFVTILWSSSWLFIKWGLKDIPPILFSGLRYAIASLILLGLIFIQPKYRSEIVALDKMSYLKFGFYGLILITVTQGAQFVSLLYLPAISVTLILNLTIIAVLALSFVFLNEKTTKIQQLLIFTSFLGIIIYFHNKIDESLNLFGLLIAIIGMLANASSIILGRSINKSKTNSPLVLTGISMTIGSFLLLVLALTFESIPSLNLLSIFYIVYLGLVNTALAFTIWNKTMQTLRAIDSTLINNLMTPQIVLLAFFFLNEIPSLLDWIGIIVIVGSILLIQINQAQVQTQPEEVE